MEKKVEDVYKKIDKLIDNAMIKETEPEVKEALKLIKEEEKQQLAAKKKKCSDKKSK